MHCSCVPGIELDNSEVRFHKNLNLYLSAQFPLKELCEATEQAVSTVLLYQDKQAPVRITS